MRLTSHPVPADEQSDSSLLALAPAELSSVKPALAAAADLQSIIHTLLSFDPSSHIAL